MERYEAYKDSGVEWIGEIPEGWKTRRLKSLASSRVEPAAADSGAYIGLENVQPFTMKIVRVDESPSGSEGILYNDKCVLFGKLRPYLAKVALPNESGPCSSEFLSLSPSNFNRKFLAYLLVSGRFISEVNSLTYGVRMPRAGWDIVSKINMPVPPLDEQQAIADFLDAKTAEIDGLVADCEREVELLQEYRKAVISEAVTKGLDPHAPMKDSGVEWIGDIPEGWSVARIKHVASTFGRIGFRGYRSEDLVSAGEGAMTLSPSNMENGELLLDKVSYLSWEKYDESPEIQIEAGDILFTKTGSSYGKTAYVANLPMEATINPQLLAIKDILCNPKFLYYQTCADWLLLQVAQNVVGGTIPTIAQSKIDNFAICNPPLAEQQAIADFLDAKTAEIDGLIEAKRQMAEKLREYRKSLISEAVTGKFKVPGVA